MAEQNVIIKMLADVSGADASFRKMRQTLSRLSDGTLTLGKNMRVFEKGTRGSISAQQAAEKVAKQFNTAMQAQLTTAKGNAAAIQAVTAMRNAEAKAIRAQVALIQAKQAQDNAVLRGLQQDLKLRELSIKEIELENRALRANTAAKRENSGASKEMATGVGVANNRVQASQNITGGATFALTSLGQAFSDAGQFGMGFAQGIRAITNNVQQVATGMFFLNQQTGGMKASMLALKGALTGPLGILFAIQIVTAGFELLTGLMQKSKREAKEAKNAFGDLFEVMQGAEIGKVAITTDDTRAATKRLSDELLDLEAKMGFAQTRSTFLTQALANIGGMATSTEAAISELARRSEEISTALEPFKEQIKLIEDEKRLRDLLNETLTEEERIRGAIAAVSERQNNIMQDSADDLLKNIEDISDEVGELVIDVEPLRLFGQAILDTIRDTGKEVSDMRENLVLLQSSEGLRLAELERQEESLKRQIGLQRAMNDLLAIGAPVGADPARIGFRGTDSPLGDEDETARTLRLLGSGQTVRIGLPGLKEQQKALREFTSENEKNAERIAKANEKMRQSFQDLGASLIASVASIGGGLEGMQRSFGQFAMRYGEELISIGLGSIKLGFTIEAVKRALTAFQGVGAIVAGTALVAAGSAMKARARSSARRLQGGATGSTRAADITAAPGASGFSGFDTGQRFSAGSVTSLSAGSGLAVNVRGRLVAEGRELVAVVNNEVAAQRRSGVRNPLVVQ